ncbi:MAG: helix-turn-helix transcriptional regulator [Methylotenera sp.]
MAENGAEIDSVWRIKMLEQGLAQLGQALLIVSGRGEVLFASETAEALLTSQCGLSIVNQKLVAELEPDNFRLQTAIQTAIDAHHSHENSIGIYVHRNQHPRPYYLAVSRLSKHGEERRDGHNVLILIKDLSLNFERWAERLKVEFDLSPREIECVVLLTERRDVHEISEVMGICAETVRQYIKSVFKKMDIRKQHELVSLALEYRRNR